MFNVIIILSLCVRFKMLKKKRIFRVVTERGQLVSYQNKQ